MWDVTLKTAAQENSLKMGFGWMRKKRKRKEEVFFPQDIILFGIQRKNILVFIKALQRRISPEITRAFLFTLKEIFRQFL